MKLWVVPVLHFPKRPMEKKRGLRQVSLGKGDEIDSKPFTETLRVIKPAQESLANTWKRVLRGGGVTHPAKRRQLASRPGY